MANQATVLIVAKPGPMRDGLRALLAALPPIKDIEQVEDVPAALGALRRLRPILMLVDAGLFAGSAVNLLRQARTASPQTRCVLLADSMPQQQALQAAGVDAALLHGAPAPALAATIEQLLAGPQPPAEKREAQDRPAAASAQDAAPADQ